MHVYLAKPIDFNEENYTCKMCVLHTKKLLNNKI